MLIESLSFNRRITDVLLLLLQLCEFLFELFDLTEPGFFLALVLLCIELKLGGDFLDLLLDRLVFLLDKLKVFLRQVRIAVALKLTQAASPTQLHRFNNIIMMMVMMA